jgi:hypothetical protein
MLRSIVEISLHFSHVLISDFLSKRKVLRLYDIIVPPGKIWVIAVAVSISETSVHFYDKTGRNNPEDRYLNTPHCENLKLYQLVCFLDALCHLSISVFEFIPVLTLFFSNMDCRVCCWTVTMHFNLLVLRIRTRKAWFYKCYIWTAWKRINLSESDSTVMLR